MKIAVNRCTWNGYTKVTQQGGDLDTFLNDAKAAGCQGVELGGLHKDFDEPQAALDHVLSKGLDIAAYSAGVTYNPWEPNVKDYRLALDWASKMGVKTIMVCGGFPITPRRNVYDLDFDLFASSIGPMVDYADDHGLIIAYHPHRGSICETRAETERILERVPKLKLCVDTAHLASCYDNPVDFIRILGSHIVYTHLKEQHFEKNCFMELGQGDGSVDLAACLQALKDIHYQGWYGIELDRTWTESCPTPIESTKMSVQALLAHRQS